MESASPKRLGTILASCSSVQRSLDPVTCLKDDISLCQTYMQNLCYIFSTGPKSPASEVLQDALKSISTQMSLATDRAVQQMDGEHYLESIYNKGKRIKCHGNFRG